MTYIFIGAFCTNCLTAANSTENAYSYTLACLLLYRISFFSFFFAISVSFSDVSAFFFRSYF